LPLASAAAGCWLLPKQNNAPQQLDTILHTTDHAHCVVGEYTDVGTAAVSKFLVQIFEPKTLLLNSLSVIDDSSSIFVA
jgi:hypothetical protein